MCFKNKMIAAALCAIVAGIGIFGIGNNIASATATSTTSTGYATLGIEQLQKIVENLIQQIQQLRQMIAELKPLETCGNGKCRFGETAASCPADCGATNCANECTGSGERKCEGAGFFQTCGNYDADPCLEWSSLNSCPSGQICSGGKCASKVTVCGNYYCETGETAASCPTDCKTAECIAIWQPCTPATTLNSSGATVLTNEELVAQIAAVQSQLQNTSDSGQIGILQSQLQTLLNQKSATQQCCNGLTCRIGNNSTSGICVEQILKAVCGNGTCESGETAASCPADCGEAAACAKEGESRYSNFSKLKDCCVGLIPVDYVGSSGGTAPSAFLMKTCAKCGDKVCGKGETPANCAKDCPTASCYGQGEGVAGFAASPKLSCCAGLTPAPRAVTYTNGSISVTEGFICINCGNGKCETGETAANCPVDCVNNTTCKTAWWSDNTSKICQQKEFCGSYMYLGLKIYNTQSDCQKALDATCSQECVAKGYALGGNYCVANSQGILESCCCSGSASKCGNGKCETGENIINCPKDCLAGSNVDPIGYFDVATCKNLSGWVCDKNDPSLPVTVHFYADGKAGSGGKLIGSTVATTVREKAVGDLCGGNVRHGFVFETPASVRDGKSHLIYAYGINIPTGNNPLLQTNGKTITCVAGSTSDLRTGSSLTAGWSAIPKGTY